MQVKLDAPLSRSPVWVVVWVRLGLVATAILTLGFGAFIHDGAGPLLLVVGVVSVILAKAAYFLLEKLLNLSRRTEVWRRITMGSIAVLGATIAILTEGFPRITAIAASTTALIAIVTLEVADIASRDR